MTCTAQGCRNVQCYVCSKSCNYAHFDDRSRGGKQGNCPLFDRSVDLRHEDEVRLAEETARKKVAEENPDIDSEFLQFKLSDKVLADEQRRKNLPGQGRPVPGGVPALRVVHPPGRVAGPGDAAANMPPPPPNENAR